MPVWMLLSDSLLPAGLSQRPAVVRFVLLVVYTLTLNYKDKVPKTNYIDQGTLACVLAWRQPANCLQSLYLVLCGWCNLLLSQLWFPEQGISLQPTDSWSKSYLGFKSSTIPNCGFCRSVFQVNPRWLTYSPKPLGPGGSYSDIWTQSFYYRPLPPLESWTWPTFLRWPDVYKGILS